jgi:hypothetical protein
MVPSLGSQGKSWLKAIRVSNSPLALQRELAQRQKLAQVSAQVTSRTRLGALFQTMLHRAFDGDL